MPSVIVAGGGLAGLAATAALADAGYNVTLFESKPYLGGRATSYEVPLPDGGSSGLIDNCQHILLRCCVNLLDFYRRLGVGGEIDFYREFYFIEPGGRTSVFGANRFPYPLHFTKAFLGMQFLTLAEKVALGRGFLQLIRDGQTRRDLQSITMAQWLCERGQPERVIERFWRQVLVSAVNEELDVMAASHGFQVFLLGFLGSADSFHMGVPRIPLGALYAADRWKQWPNVQVVLRTSVQAVDGDSVTVNKLRSDADAIVVALPWHKVGAVLTGYEAPELQSSPITGVHLWFDRPVMEVPHATLLDRTVQWVFNKGGGRHLQLLVSASRSLVTMPRAEVIQLVVHELGEFFPAVQDAQLVRAHVAKEVHATFSAIPGAMRPGTSTQYERVFVAGDWTASGWPSTMEGAVRSGYRAAEAVTAVLGRPQKFVLPDIRALTNLQAHANTRV